MYGMPPEGYAYGGFAPPPYMGHPMYAPHGHNFGAPPPHMQGIYPPTFPPAAGDGTPSVPKPLGERAAASPCAQPPEDVSDVQKGLASMQVNGTKPTDTQAKRDVPAEVTSVPVSPFAPTQPKPENALLAEEALTPPVTQASIKKPETSMKPPATTTTEAKPNVPAASGEFDFEKANARFTKKLTAPQGSNQDSGKLSAIPPADTQSFYDKKSGFFDNISSEVKDRLEGGRSRNAIAEEKERNILTFGDEAVNFTGPPRRSRGRGHRSRGRGRGGRNNAPSKPEWA